MASRKLKLFNGRWKNGGSVFVAAYSIDDAVRLGQQAVAATPGWWSVTRYEVAKYWSKGTWGRSMEEITPERGVWIKPKEYDAQPERVV